MSRNPRAKSKTGLYHVMIRGINKQDIFLDGHYSFREGIAEVNQIKHFLFWQPAIKWYGHPMLFVHVVGGEDSRLVFQK